MSTITDLRAEIKQYWSQSRIGLFMLCSLKYAFSYVYKVKPGFTPLALVFGSATHRTLEMMAHARKDGAPMKETDSKDLFAEIWQRQIQEEENIKYGEGQDAESCLQQGQQIIGVFHANTDPEEQVLGVSEAMAVPLVSSTGEIIDDPLIGELDLLVKDRDDRTLIIDWKTSARKWPRDKAAGETQPTAMIYAYKQTHGELPGFRYDIAIKTKTPGFQQQSTERNQDHFDRLVWLVQCVERAVKAEAFLPSPGFMCSSCQYAGACKEWHRNVAQESVQTLLKSPVTPRRNRKESHLHN